MMKINIGILIKWNRFCCFSLDFSWITNIYFRWFFIVHAKVEVSYICIHSIGYIHFFICSLHSRIDWKQQHRLLAIIYHLITISHFRASFISQASWTNGVHVATSAQVAAMSVCLSVCPQIIVVRGPEELLMQTLGPRTIIIVSICS